MSLCDKLEAGLLHSQADSERSNLKGVMFPHHNNDFI
jgi:hypothetical protein